MAAAIPALVQVADRLGGGLVQADHPRDLGAALAAQAVDLRRARRAAA